MGGLVAIARVLPHLHRPLLHILAILDVKIGPELREHHAHGPLCLTLKPLVVKSFTKLILKGDEFAVAVAVRKHIFVGAGLHAEYRPVGVSGAP